MEIDGTPSSMVERLFGKYCFTYLGETL